MRNEAKRLKLEETKNKKKWKLLKKQINSEKSATCAKWVLKIKKKKKSAKTVLNETYGAALNAYLYVFKNKLLIFINVKNA